MTSFVLFFIAYGAFNNAVTPEGTNLDGHQLFGTVVSTNLVLVVTAQVNLMNILPRLSPVINFVFFNRINRLL